ncbi:hypothetical protein GCM10010988_03610 [Cnuibacter physcomitrellae]|nr:hypothetical protein GCM10010988_03610 [Cnuibacter physcomitrellae]
MIGAKVSKTRWSAAAGAIVGAAAVLPLLTGCTVTFGGTPEPERTAMASDQVAGYFLDIYCPSQIAISQGPSSISAQSNLSQKLGVDIGSSESCEGR